MKIKYLTKTFIFIFFYICIFSNVSGKIKFDKYLTSQIASTFEEIQSLSTELNSLEQRERKLVSDIKNIDIDRDENSLE